MRSNFHRNFFWLKVRRRGHPRSISVEHSAKLPEVEYKTERLDHLGIVAGVCKEAGIAQWLDRLAGETRRSVSVGTAVVAMILNGLGFSNRQLYLVPQYFENKPVEHLLGEGITADMQSVRYVGANPRLDL